MQLFGLIGYPLTHSFSKKYFTEKFEQEGLHDYQYENFPIASIDELPALIAKNPHLKGLNVTIPYKQAVIEYLTERSDIVKTIEACNCIALHKGQLIGYNTDTIGFEKTLTPHLRPAHRKALILGTGGAAKAVEFVLTKLGINWKYVSRKPSVQQYSYEQLTPAVIKEHLLIINTTPLGMYPNIIQAPPIPYEALTPGHLMFDLIYNPAKTLFLQKGEEKGAAIVNGQDMLIIQAEESWKIWTEMNA